MIPFLRRPQQRLLLLPKLLLLLLFLPIATNGLRILIQYKDDSFLDMVLEYAMDRQIVENITARKLIVINVDDNADRGYKILQQIQDNPNVEYWEEDPIVQPMFLDDSFLDFENRPDFNISQREVTPYGIEMIQAPELWDIPEVDETLSVCVVDTGMHIQHPDLPGVVRDEVRGTNTDEGLWYEDGSGHGTHCTGTIGAIGDNDEGVVGVRPNPNVFRFHIGKALSNDGSGHTSSTLAAVQGCVDNGAKVISMSLGSSRSTRSSKRLYKDLYENEDILFVAAAGNDGNSGHSYPASYDHVMSVAAVDRNETRAYFSQCNKQVEIAAPGVGILSTYPSLIGYSFLSGTSMACPHVAGAAAALWSRFPECKNYQIRNVLLRSARHVGEYKGCHNGLGSGLIQVKDAYDMLSTEGCEAGGTSSEAVGGCQQNPDFDKNDNDANPYYKDCPGDEGGSGISTASIVVGVVAFFAALACLALFLKRNEPANIESTDKS